MNACKIQRGYPGPYPLWILYVMLRDYALWVQWKFENLHKCFCWLWCLFVCFFTQTHCPAGLLLPSSNIYLPLLSPVSKCFHLVMQWSQPIVRSWVFFDSLPVSTRQWHLVWEATITTTHGNLVYNILNKSFYLVFIISFPKWILLIVAESSRTLS